MQHITCITPRHSAKHNDVTHTCAVVPPEDSTSAIGGAASLPAASHKGRATVALCSTSTTADVLRLTPSKSQSSPFFPPGALRASGSENVVLGLYPHSRDPSCSSASRLCRSKDSAPRDAVAGGNQSRARKPAAFPEADAKSEGEESRRWMFRPGES